MLGHDALISVILCSMLSSPYFPARYKAEEALMSMGCRAEVALLAASKSPDLEQRYRAQRCLALLLPQKAEAILARNKFMGGTPWADALPRKHPLGNNQLYALYTMDGRVWEREKFEPEPYRKYRAITYVWIMDEVCSGNMTFDAANAVLDAMVKRSVWWGPGGWTDPED